MTEQDHAAVIERERVIDSDNYASRCGCPSVDAANRWTVEILSIGVLVGECAICRAAWQWGEICAQPMEAP